jgi:hypothetical protein
MGGNWFIKKQNQKIPWHCPFKSKFAKHRWESTNRLAMATFWRTFHHHGKISPAWWGWGVHTLYLSLYLPSRAKLCCTGMLQLRGQIHSSYFSSTVFSSVLLTIPQRLLAHNCMVLNKPCGQKKSKNLSDMKERQSYGHSRRNKDEENSNVVIPKMKVCFPKTKSTKTFLKQNKQILSIFCFKKHWMQIRISKVWTEFKICIKEKRGTQIFINVMQIRNTAFPKNIVTLMSWVRYRKRI